ncbi:hypothetical protein HOC01_03530 [archaeon]|jgi:tRNA wybutosine-synthesizing protein 3|nr:hypothetical protein [archaeon]MBT6698517.1 hypothetical protein [archaeon]
MAFSVNVDKSPQGFIDADIIDLLDVLNKEGGDYETTSSCSGRITLMSGVKKGDAKWVYKTHDACDFLKVFEIVSGLGDDEVLRFMYEPFIVHIKCKNFEAASSMLSILHTNGLKKSGMISLKNLILELNDTGRIETVLDNSLTKGYIERLCAEANRRLVSTKARIKKCEELFFETKSL